MSFLQHLSFPAVCRTRACYAIDSNSRLVATPVSDRSASWKQLVFRFEPFILAVECSDIDTAQQTIQVARLAGFRESGATIGTHGRVIVDIRCSIRIEAPVAEGGRLLVTQEYFRCLAIGGRTRNFLHHHCFGLARIVACIYTNSGSAC